MKRKHFFLLGILVSALFAIVVLVPKETFADVTGSGTVDDPYVAGSSVDLTTALANGNGSSETLYVKLSNDITYTDSNQFTIYSNVVIDGLKDNTAGSYYKMLKTGTSTTTTTAGFYLNSSGYDVTFQNLSFGDNTYSYYQTYYGIILGYTNQVDLVMRNVDYYGSAGGQPLCSYNGESTFTFEGTNNFNVQPGSGSQEFMEGANVSFADNSNTTINHISAYSNTLFYNSTSTNPSRGTTVAVGANAVVNITTNSTYFTYSNTTVDLTLADSAQFNYTATANGFNFSNSASTTSTYTVGNNATFAVAGSGKVGELGGRTATFNTNTPAEISFANTAGSNGLFYGSSTLNTSSSYQFDYTVGDAVSTIDAATPSVALTDSTFATNVTKVVYYPRSDLSYTAAANVTNATGNENATSVLDLSNISASLSYSLSSIDYKIFSTSPLASDADVTTSENQSTITNATGANYSGTITTNALSLSNVPAGEYTIFVRGVATSSNGKITQTTKWVMQTVTVAKSTLNVGIPVSMTFAIVDNASFTSPDTYSTTNRSNYPTTFGVNSVTEVSDITLVSDINNTTASNPLYLGLRNTEDSSSEIPFVSSDGTKKTFNLSAFGGTIPFELVGQYGGTVNTSGIRDFEYTLTIVIGS